MILHSLQPQFPLAPCSSLVHTCRANLIAFLCHTEALLITLSEVWTEFVLWQVALLSVPWLLPHPLAVIHSSFCKILKLFSSLACYILLLKMISGFEYCSFLKLDLSKNCLLYRFKFIFIFDGLSRKMRQMQPCRLPSLYLLNNCWMPCCVSTPFDGMGQNFEGVVCPCVLCWCLVLAQLILALLFLTPV